MDKILDLKKKPEAKESSEEKFEPFNSGKNQIHSNSDFEKPDISPISDQTRDHSGAATRTVTSLPVQLSWSGLLYDHSPNFKALVIFSGILFAVAAFFIFFQRNIFAAIFFIVATVFLLASSKKKSPETDFSVGPLSVRIGTLEHNFKDIKSFWVEYNPEGTKELSLQLKRWYLPYIKIPLYNQNPVQIRVILLKFIPEVEHEDTMMNVIERLLGF